MFNKFLIGLLIVILSYIGWVLWGNPKPDLSHLPNHDVKIVTVAGGLEYPWGMDFLPNGDILLSEREGRLRIIRRGVLDPRPIDGLPDNIYVAGQGGLLDVAVHPAFEHNQRVYFSYAGSGEGGAGTEVAYGRLNGQRLEDVTVIFRVFPKNVGEHHYGSRLLFDRDGYLYITLGDRYHGLNQAQDLSDHLGSIIRLHDDGRVPEDNPCLLYTSPSPRDS